MDSPKRNNGKQPPPEIEIIPPDRADRFRERGRSRIVFSFGTRQGRAGQASLPSPLALVLAGVIFVVLAGLFAVAVIGTLLIWIPLALLALVLAMAVGFLRRSFRPPR